MSVRLTLLLVGLFIFFGFGLVYKNIFITSSKTLDIPNCNRCNIVLIVIDPLRHDELPCYGYFRNTTPNICNLADRSLLFENAYSQSSWTLPSIMSLFSSQYPNTHNVFVPHQDVLSPQVTTVPQAFKTLGYHTVYVGTTNDSHIPLDKGIGRGFDSIVPYESIDTATQLLDDLEQTSPFFLFIHSFDLRVSGTKVNKDQEFVFDPSFTFKYEPPLPGSDPTRDTPQNIKFLRNMYDQRLYELDKKIGSLLVQLEKNNLTQKTIVTITSNHGDEFGEHGNTSHGINLYDTVTHVPLIMSIPQTKPSRRAPIAQSIDIYPTLLTLIGGKPQNLTGKNILSKKHNEPNAFSISQLEPIKHLSVIRNTQWALYINELSNHPPQFELYNLTTDPTEQANVASSYPETVQTLHQKYTETTKSPNTL